MHELSICESLVAVIEEQAVAQSFDSVKTVRLEIGALAGIELEALQFSFDVVTKGGVADGAALEVVEIPVVGWCEACAQSVDVQERFDPCPLCGSFQVQITSGEELRIKELEVL